MAKYALDLNTVEEPELALTLRDEAHTQLTVLLPYEALIQELQSNLPALQETLQKGTVDSLPALYDLAARLISCNREGVALTGEELRGKYGMHLRLMFAFFTAYLNMVNGVESEKN